MPLTVWVSIAGGGDVLFVGVVDHAAGEAVRGEVDAIAGFAFGAEILLEGRDDAGVGLAVVLDDEVLVVPDRFDRAADGVVDPVVRTVVLLVSQSRKMPLPSLRMGLPSGFCS
jgi:hypothetical protein